MPLLPLVLVVMAAVFSAVYKHCYSRKLTSSVRSTLIKLHAFATEILQLFTLGAGIVVGWGFFASRTIMLDVHIIHGLDLPIPAWFVATTTVAMYCIALLAIDMIDNRIQLGCWRHPIQTQTLLLTRSSLASWSVKKRRRRMVNNCTQTSVEVSAKKAAKKQEVLEDKMDPVSTTPYQRKRTASEPVTPEMLRRFLREIPIEVSKSGTLIRQSRADARRSSAAAVDFTPTRMCGKAAVMLPTTPESIFATGKYGVQSKVAVIERMVGQGVKMENKVLPEASGKTASASCAA